MFLSDPDQVVEIYKWSFSPAVFFHLVKGYFSNN
jgi:hypothetical protein